MTLASSPDISVEAILEMVSSACSNATHQGEPEEIRTSGIPALGRNKKGLVVCSYEDNTAMLYRLSETIMTDGKQLFVLERSIAHDDADGKALPPSARYKRVRIKEYVKAIKRADSPLVRDALLSPLGVF